VTLLLASLANLYIVGGQLPKTNFLTPIDDVIYFTLFCEGEGPAVYASPSSPLRLRHRHPLFHTFTPTNN